VPTGGVTLDNIDAFFKAGAAALGVGGNLVSKELVAEEHYAGLTANARAFASAVARARS
jgi:2-dehydro-3-deoxyphosphogluconate aldolase/(4S)-4-hydroxy-2-oxoglutarate aldolase